VKQLRLHIDRIACDGRGLCAELLHEVIRLDDWGFPIVDQGAIGKDLQADAQDAVELCPRMALSLVEVDVHGATRMRKPPAADARR
jgi:ferredoxin